MNIYDIKWSETYLGNTDPMGRPPKAAAPLGAPPKAAPMCSLFLLIYSLYYECLWMFLIYSLYISYLYVLHVFHLFSFVCILKIMNLFSKTYGFGKNHKFVIKDIISQNTFANKDWKGVISEEKKKESLFCWQGLILLDWPWQVRTWPKSEFWSNFPPFGSKFQFWGNFRMVLHGFAPRNPKNIVCQSKSFK